MKSNLKNNDFTTEKNKPFFTSWVPTIYNILQTKILIHINFILLIFILRLEINLGKGHICFI